MAELLGEDALGSVVGRLGDRALERTAAGPALAHASCCAAAAWRLFHHPPAASCTQAVTDAAWGGATSLRARLGSSKAQSCEHMAL